MKDFRIRCSSISQIMTNSRSTTKSYCEEWLKEQLYGRKKFISSKYMEKGNIVEQDSLDFIADELSYGLLIKNEEYFENDFLSGTPDVILNDEIIDVKNSWDCFTFPLFEEELPNKSYYYQMQGYMALTGKQSAKVIYVLKNTPQHLIEKEAFFYCKNNGYEKLDEDVLKDFESRMKFDKIESKLRYKVFEVQRDEETIEAIKERVKECNEYINNLKSKL